MARRLPRQARGAAADHLARCVPSPRLRATSPLLLCAEGLGVLRVLNADKACIDQSNIQQSLACLPVFLAGCQTLLVVAGPTYCSRLWCVMELFTFARSERPLLIRTLLDCADATVKP